MHFSGSYFLPKILVAQKLTCKGNTKIEMLVIPASDV